VTAAGADEYVLCGALNQGYTCCVRSHKKLSVCACRQQSLQRFLMVEQANEVN
jgi:hypothetical protein